MTRSVDAEGERKSSGWEVSTVIGSPGLKLVAMALTSPGD